MTSTKQTTNTLHALTAHSQGRKPTHLVASMAGVVSQQDLIWQQARKLRRFTMDSICKSIMKQCKGVNEKTVSAYLERLFKGGYLSKQMFNQRGHEIVEWFLEKDVGLQAPRLKADGRPSHAGRAKAQLWRSMKVLCEFNYVELAAASSTNEQPVAISTARRYITSLYSVGYLVRIRKGVPTRPARYRIVPSRARGPKHPVILSDKSVFDQNLMQVMEPING